MQLRQNLLSILFLIFTLNSFACINEYRTLLSGEVIYKMPFSADIWTKEIDTNALKSKSSYLLRLYNQTDSIEYLSDYAATLIYLGELTKAKKIYEDIELRKPDLYTTASNLGTIYELMGQPQNALKWINKSIQLYPSSHEGSEWIHLKILEFKISNQKNFSESILGLSFGNSEIPVNQEHYNLNELQNQIYLQMYERSKFVKPPNKIVGNIYFDYGSIVAQTMDVQAALEIYKTSKEFGYESELMNLRINKFEELADKAKNQGQLFRFLKSNFKLFVLILLSSILILIIFRKLKRK